MFISTVISTVGLKGNFNKKKHNDINETFICNDIYDSNAVYTKTIYNHLQ